MSITGSLTLPSGLKYGHIVRMVVKLRAKEKNPEKVIRLDIR
jgi:hypothetical protein